MPYLYIIDNFSIYVLAPPARPIPGMEKVLSAAASRPTTLRELSQEAEETGFPGPIENSTATPSTEKSITSPVEEEKKSIGGFMSRMFSKKEPAPLVAEGR